MLGQPNHSHRSHDPGSRSRDGSMTSYLIGAVLAGAVLFGAYLLLRAML